MHRRDQSLDVVTSAETERQQNRVHGAAIIAQSTRARQPNLATFPTHTIINRHSQESGLLLRPTYATGPAVSSYCSSAYYHLRTISNIRHLLTLDACHAAVRSLVLSRLDYCNALLGGLNNRQLDRLLRVQNSAARVVYRVRQRDHITPTLRTLHWLPIRMRISFKICTYMFKATDRSHSWPEGRHPERLGGWLPGRFENQTKDDSV